MSSPNWFHGNNNDRPDDPGSPQPWPDDGIERPAVLAFERSGADTVRLQGPSDRGRAGPSADTPNLTPDEIPFLLWWRELPRNAFSGDNRRDLRSFLQAFALLGGARWSEATRGDASACVAEALHYCRPAESRSPFHNNSSSNSRFALAATALLAAALDGGRACQIVLAHLIRHHSICDAHTLAIIRSWIEPCGVFPTTGDPIKSAPAESDLS